MSRSRGRSKKNFSGSLIRELRSKQLDSYRAIPGSKIAKQAMKGICTIRNLSATMIFFYNKRFQSNHFAIKVM